MLCLGSKFEFDSNQSFCFFFLFSDLYEGLKMAQRGRLEDQRGTEIKFEMPEFLKRGTVSCQKIANLAGF